MSVRASLTPVCCLLVVIGASAVCNLIDAAGVPQYSQTSGVNRIVPVDDKVELLKLNSRNSIGETREEKNRILSFSTKTKSSIVSEKSPLRYLSSEVKETGSSDAAEISDVDDGDRSETANDSSRQVAPQYMLDLYNKFSTDKYSHPIANIVRSFTTINRDPAVVTSSTTTNDVINYSRTYTLTFNITSIAREEDIYLAELRIYPLIRTDVEDFQTSQICKVSVYSKNSFWSSSVDEEEEVEESQTQQQELIAFKDIEIASDPSLWDTFTVTDTVKHWVRFQTIGTYAVDVVIQDLSLSKTSQAKPKQRQTTQNDEERDDTEKHVGPLLVVFSNDRKRRNMEARELHELTLHENDYPQGVLPITDEQDEMGEDDYEEDPDEDSSTDPMTPRDPEQAFTIHSTDGRHSALGSNNKIEQSQKPFHSVRNTIEDQNNIDENERDNDDSNQYGTTNKKPVEVQLSNSVFGSNSPPFSNNIDRLAALKKRFASRSRRSVNSSKRTTLKKRKVKKHSCRRRPMYVNFSHIHWDWIIEPKGYQAYECTGQCTFPLSDHLTPTKHAVVQSRLHDTQPKKTSTVCCVPTKLESISILYLDDQNIVTYKYKYDGMVVTECGCR